MRMLRRQTWLYLAGVCALVFVVYAPLTANQARVSADYEGHADYSQLLYQGRPLPISPYYLHMVSTSVVHILTGADFKDSLGITVLLHYVLAGAAIAAAGVWAFSGTLTRPQGVVLAAFVLSVLTIAPLAPEIFTRAVQLLYGYLPPNPHHNPTNMVVRFYALVTLAMGAWVFAAHAPRWWQIALVAVFVFLSVQAKPSWIVAYLPALLAYAVLQALLRQRVNWLALGLGFVLPSLLVLGWQFNQTYDASANYAQLLFAPFEVMLLGGDSYLSLLIKLFASIAFPLSVLLLYWRELWRDHVVRLAWLTFAAAAVQAYTLAESGDRLQEGNWVWGVLLANFVLFVVMGVCWLRLNAETLALRARPSRQFVVTSVLLLAHSAIGALWWLAHLRSLNIFHQ